MSHSTPAANDGTARLFDRLRGTGHHLLLFEGDRPSADVHEKPRALARQVCDRGRCGSSHSS